MNDNNDRGARVWRAGSGPVMVLLHGEFGDASTYWAPIAGTVAQRFELVLPDLPGFGESPPLADYRLATYVFWLRQLVDAALSGASQTQREPSTDSKHPLTSTSGETGGRDERRADSIVLGGIGFGATVARAFAARYRTRVRRLILSGGGSLERPSRLHSLLSRIKSGQFGDTRGRGPRSVEHLFHDPTGHGVLEAREAFERTSAARERVRRAIVEAPLPPDLTPTCTTLLLWGSEDRYCPESTQQTIAAEIPDTRQVTIFDAGHLVSIEQPHRFGAHLLDFAAIASDPG